MTKKTKQKPILWKVCIVAFVTWWLPNYKRHMFCNFFAATSCFLVFLLGFFPMPAIQFWIMEGHSPIMSDDLIVGYVITSSTLPSSNNLFSIINFANFLWNSNWDSAGAFLLHPLSLHNFLLKYCNRKLSDWSPFGMSNIWQPNGIMAAVVEVIYPMLGMFVTLQQLQIFKADCSCLAISPFSSSHDPQL